MDTFSMGSVLEKYSRPLIQDIDAIWYTLVYFGI